MAYKFIKISDCVFNAFQLMHISYSKKSAILHKASDRYPAERDNLLAA